MSSANLIHIKFEYKEALETKENLLMSEQNLLKTSRNIKNYKILRLEELKTKAKLHKTIKEALLEISKLDKNLPKIKTPEILKHHFNEEVEEAPLKEKIKSSKVFNEEENIESQIREIQEKLRQLKI